MLPHVDETILPHQTSAAQLLKSPSWWHPTFCRCAGDPADHSPAHMLWKREHDSLPTAHTLPVPNNLRGNLNAFSYIYINYLNDYLTPIYCHLFFLVYMFRLTWKVEWTFSLIFFNMIQLAEENKTFIRVKMCLLLLLLRYEVVRVALCRDVCATTVFSYLLITSSSHSVSQKFGDTYSSFSWVHIIVYNKTEDIKTLSGLL